MHSPRHSAEREVSAQDSPEGSHNQSQAEERRPCTRPFRNLQQIMDTYMWGVGPPVDLHLFLDRLLGASPMGPARVSSLFSPSSPSLAYPSATRMGQSQRHGHKTLQTLTSRHPQP